MTSGGIPAAKPSLQPTGSGAATSSQQNESEKTGRISQREALAAVEPASDEEELGEEGA